MSLRSHLKECDKKGSSKRRLSRNKYSFETRRVNHHTGETEQVYLEFAKGNYYQALKYPIFSTFDMECTNRLAATSSYESTDEQVPKNALYEQQILAYAFKHVTCYPETLPLPNNLVDVRINFLDDDSTSETAFFYKMFIEIRRDIPLLNQHLETVLQESVPLKPLIELTFKERLEYFLATNCSLCGKAFGSVVKSKKGGSSYKLKKCRDHEVSFMIRQTLNG